MTHHERKMEARHETASGPLERITFLNEDDGEKSLLTLIEEHRPQLSECPTASSEGSCNSSANPPDDLEGDEGHRLDHLMMRLGRNGF